MLALEIDYLLGRVLATARSDRAAPEWPPHPARLFSALLATLHEAELDPAEHAAGRAALAWLETLPPPALSVAPARAAEAGRAGARSALSTWVPVNPSAAEVADVRNTPRAFVAEGLRLPRKRAERSFPAFAPDEPRVAFIWTADAAACTEHAPALDRLARELGYLGHSASPVRARLLAADAIPAPTLQPAASGELALRVPGPGRLARLEACFAAGVRCGRRIEPPPGRMQAYAPVREVEAEPPQGLYRIGAIYRRAEGPPLPAPGVPVLAQAVRNNLLRLAPQPVPTVISGHEADGSATRQAHLAVVPLPRVGDEHADGAPLGVAVLVPALLEAAGHEAVDDVLAALAGAPLTLGRFGVWALERLSAATAAQAARTLQPQTWSRPARVWASATPVVFGHHPRPGNPKRDALALLARHCADLGLPAPVAVAHGPLSRLRGAAPAAAFRQGSAGARWHGQFVAHVVVTFAAPVAGPLVLGAGRHFGLGLMRPFDDRGRT
ncbi:CRISPR-associated protein Csb2 [Plasticicumulans lactativorans]|uniref:CRISPR-associated protein Csb2 n=1 Tax=Plasticicumulans lactativorans TaxID=1133106 RepID=A0A4R2L0Y3_9GAMM|nr:type I-U CRISPR-associated protein Csb2 [Plasticicumulans lactativorans]TCO78837.1 CRISPR-associated protein Csb2 [Plasticicumulans lactativorans]